MSNGVEKVEIPDEYVVRDIYGEKDMKRALLVLVGLQGLQGGRAQGPGDSRDGEELGTTSWSMSTWTMMVWLIGFAAMVATMAWSRRNRGPEREGEDGDRREREALLEEGGEEAMVEDDTEVEEEDFVVKQEGNVVRDTYKAVCQNAVTQKSGNNYIIFKKRKVMRTNHQNEDYHLDLHTWIQKKLQTVR